MHSDLLMLRVACRVVEGAAPSSASSGANNSASATTPADADARAHAMTDLDAKRALPRLVLPAITLPALPTTTSSSSWDARRIPSLRLQRPLPGDAAAGLKRPPSHHSHPSNSSDDEAAGPMVMMPRHKRARHAQGSPSDRASPPSAPPPPGVFMDSPLAKLVHAQRPPPALPMCSPLGVEGVVDTKSQPRVARRPPPPTQNPHDKLSPLESPRASTVGAEPATSDALHVLAPLRAPPQMQQASPLPSLASCRHQSANMPPLALPAATSKPTLVRKSSAPWRQQMPAQDRAHTRARILRGLDRQCRGDYDALLRIVTALDEELLHAHTTSKDHYFFQTVALRDRIATLAPPRTAHPDHAPR